MKYVSSQTCVCGILQEGSSFFRDRLVNLVKLNNEVQKSSKVIVPRQEKQKRQRVVTCLTLALDTLHSCDFVLPY